LKINYLKKGKNDLLINFTGNDEMKHRIESNGFNKLTPTVITNHIYFQRRKISKMSLSSLISMVDIDKRTPLHIACLINNLDIIKILLDNNSPLELKDKSGKVKLIINSEIDRFN